MAEDLGICSSVYVPVLGARGPQRASLHDSILIVDQASIGKVVRKLLETQQGWNACGEAGDGKQAVEQAEVLNPHLIVLDIRMPILNGFEAR